MALRYKHAPSAEIWVKLTMRLRKLLNVLAGAGLLILCVWLASSLFQPKPSPNDALPETTALDANTALPQNAEADDPSIMANPDLVQQHTQSPTSNNFTAAPSNAASVASTTRPPSTQAYQPPSPALNMPQRLNQDQAYGLARRGGWEAKGDTDDFAFELQGIDGLYVLMNRTMNNKAAISTTADLVRNTLPYNVDGSNILVGVWDAGSIRTTHQEFGGRVTSQDRASAHFHSTHVGGTVAASGVQTAAMGMASGTIVDSYDWNSDEAEMTARGMSAPGQTNKIHISNHSYGFIVGWEYGFSPVRWYGTYNIGQTNREAEGFGQYTSDTRSWDVTAYNTPYLMICKSAGNDRSTTAPSGGTTFQFWDGSNWTNKTYDSAVDPLADGQHNGFDTIGVRGNAKNVLTVGATQDAWNGSERDTSIAFHAGFSCFGPTDDGRIKPDIMGNGIGLYSTGHNTDSEYITLQGTSMSSPNVAGSATLLADYYHTLFSGAVMRASSLKGLIIHTADNLGNGGPDYRYGWGLMNTKTAADLIKFHSDFPNTLVMKEDSLSNTNLTSSYDITWDNANFIRVTLCWTDPPGPALTGLNNTNLALVNDLDLRIIDPTGATNFPYILDPANPNAGVTRGDNFRDNVEQNYLSTSTNPGVYQIQISIKGGSVSNGVQPYSMWVTGASAKPELTHEEASNTTNTVDDYSIDLTASPIAIINTNDTWIYWMATGDTNGFASNALAVVTNDIMTSTIPAHSNGSTLLYYFKVANTDGISCLLPIDAPTNTFSFEVTGPLDLTVTGTPVEAGTVNPDYGTHSYASGSLVNVSAPAFTSATNGSRYAGRGYTGSGSAPATGTLQTIQFTLDIPSVVDWHWQKQYELTQVSQPSGLLSTSSWVDANTTGSTTTAASPMNMSGTVYRFTQWSVNGFRLPDDTNTAVNPAPSLFINTQTMATALYLDETADTDTDNLDDWWETFYFGSTNADPAVDNDLDGFTNLEEFDDQSDPRDIASTPASPGIQHTPLASAQTNPAPFLVSAVVTDNFSVASVTLHHNRNGMGIVQTAMTNFGGDTYMAEIPAPGTNGDMIVYSITAADPAGLTSTNGDHTINIDYPLIFISPTGFPVQLLLAGTSTNLSLAITNSGSADLEWRTTLMFHGLEDSVETGSNGWSHSGANDQWHITDDRVMDGTQAWHCGSGMAGIYANDMNASLDTPTVYLGENAELTFYHYADFELGGGSTAWDGAIVEISTNDGASFAQIFPEADYPYTIVPNVASPFADNQPCFANTSSSFRKDLFDLSSFSGQHTIIRFRAGTDSFVGDEGWYIDQIIITPNGGTNTWLQLTPATGQVAAASADTPALTMDTLGIASGTDLGKTLVIDHNDPTRGPISLQLSMQVRSRPVLTWTDAAQISTNGDGQVSLDLDAEDADGEALEMLLEFSTDGVSWTQTWLSSASAQTGAPGITNGADSRVTQIQTDNGGLITNPVSAMWSSTNAPTVLLDSNTTARAQAFDGLFWSDPVTSSLFMVDNENPIFTDTLSSPSHTILVWSSAQVVQVNWEPANDGTGSGIHGYSHLFATPAPTPPSGELTASSTSVLSSVLAEGTSWYVNVQARDIYGNRSATHSMGPFLIDTNVPSTATATLILSSNEFGAYSLGPILTGTWAGVTDSGSGIDTYFIALSDGSGTTNGTESAGLTDTLIGPEDQTNTLFVWARDLVGRIGTAMSANLLLLSPAGDYDGDMISNSDESITGTDASDYTDVWEIGDIPPVISTNSELPVIQWPYTTNRLYQVEWVDSMGVTTGLVWQVYSNPVYSVSNGWAIWTDTNSLPDSPLTNRLYRIGVSLAP